MKNDPISMTLLGKDGKPRSGVQDAIMKGIGVQRPLVLAYIKRLRKKHPEATTAQLAAIAERDYLRVVTGSGAAVGGTAAVPAVGTGVALGLSVAATLGFLEASALYAQSLAELHGIAIDDPDRSRVLVMGIMMGEEGSSMISGLTSQVAGRGGGPIQGWARSFGVGKSKTVYSSVQRALQKKFLRKIIGTQAASTLGRLVPFGVGAAIGGVGNRYMAKRVIENAGVAFAGIPTIAPSSLPLDDPRVIEAEIVED
ncbi:hypothetical protein ACTXM3_15810 [Glutamicibacter arilaitensis]|jgi:hypothetical protein|uniref:hypothetical protein n=1 Tax=Glutamicibacter TaxID=1742989 RepID=UPI000ED1A192|nr:hypothetical protein [Glutamicibacter sp.]HCJ53025.1 hypothetical protein [Glutamicibacter sp.]